MRWLTEKPKESGRPAALVADEQGLSFAQIARRHDQPVCEQCHYHSWQSDDKNREVQQCLRQWGLGKNQTITTVMPAGSYTILSIDAPDVPANELKAAVRWQIKDLVDFDIDEAIIDVFDAPASGAGNHQHSLYVVVSQRSSVQQQVDLLQDVNLTTIDIPELVLRNISACQPQDEDGMALLYLEKNSGMLVLTRQGTLYLARSLDLGTEQLQLTEQQEFDAHQFNEQLDTITLELQRSLDYYDRYFMLPAINKVVLAPTVQAVPGLQEYLEIHLDVKCSTLDLSGLMQGPSTLDMAQQARSLLAIGAALRVEKRSL